MHGDLTTSNFLVPASGPLSVFCIDFGLTYQSSTAEDRAVDLHVLERAFASTHPSKEHLMEALLEAYKEAAKGSAMTMARLNAVRERGRKRSMLG